MKKRMLDDLSAAIEKVVNDLRGGSAAPTKKRMPLGEFVTYALTQISAAAKDKPDVSKRRLSALKRSVDGVIAAVAKMAAEDTDSETIQVEVETAFAPTKADGDTAMADLTTASDQGSTEISVTGVAAPAGDSSFAENLKAVAKALKKLQADLEPAPDGKPRKPAKKADRGTGEAGDADRAGGSAGAAGEGADADEGSDGWPLDLNTEAFLKGEAGPEARLTWGADPAGVGSPKNR